MSDKIESQQILTDDTNSNAINEIMATVFDFPYMISTAYYKFVSNFIDSTIGLVKDTIVSFMDSMKPVIHQIEDNNRRVKTNMYKTYSLGRDSILSFMDSMKPVIHQIADKVKIHPIPLITVPETLTFWQKLSTRYKAFVNKIQEIWSSSIRTNIVSWA